MAGGQILDLAAEGRFAGRGHAGLGADEVRTLQAMKTGKLIEFACIGGAMLGHKVAVLRTPAHFIADRRN